MKNTEREGLQGWVKVALALALLALLGGGAGFYINQKQIVQRNAKDRFYAIGQTKVNQIAAWRTDLLRDAAILSSSPLLMDVMHGYLSNPGEKTTRLIRDYLRHIQANYPVADVLLTDPRGRILMSLSGNLEPLGGYRDALETACQNLKPVFTELTTEDRNPVPHISTVAPVPDLRDRTGKPAGVLILVYDASRFLYPLIQSWPLPSKSAETLLVRQDGDEVLFLNNLRHQEDAALKLRIPLTRTDVPAVMAVQGMKDLVQGRDYRGEEVLAVLLPVPDSPWFMVAKENVDEVFAEWYFRAFLILALLSGGIAFTGATGWALWQKSRKSHFRNLYQTEAKLRSSIERHSITLKAIGDAVISTDLAGRVEVLNPVAEGLTGWAQDQASGRPLSEVFHIINEETRQTVENPVSKVLREGMVVGLANHTLLIAKDGQERPIADSAAPIRDEKGRITGVVLVFRDQTDERRVQRLNQVRMTLLEYASTHTLGEFLTKTLDEIGVLVNSPVGFYHFVSPDQQTLSLQQWSTRTLKEFCQTQGGGMHYGIDQAGVWADCVREGKPVIHNNYDSLPDKKGMPQGHARVIRELVVPVMRNNRAAAILGVGNKPVDYTEADVDAVSFLADATWQIVEKKQSDQALAHSHELMQYIIEHNQSAIAVHDQNLNYVYVSRRYLDEYNVKEDVIGKHHYEVFPDLPQKWRDVHQRSLAGEIVRADDDPYVREDGSTEWTRWECRPWHASDGSIGGIIIYTEVITQRKRLEDQVRQAQKMEAIGRLAGGVAHDFNNMLSVILGYAELAMEIAKPDDPLHGPLKEIQNAANRSAKITRQLLAFARKQTIAPRVLDLNEIVEGMLRMLRRLIGEDIELKWLPAADMWPLNMDPSQIDQILANLCVNARDAMDGGGRVVIETGRATFDEEACMGHADCRPGDFVLLAVSDNGQGMDKPTLDNLFEPFFTTKEVGQGTGLGLSTVYGIVQQNKGFIHVYSEPRTGTSFKIYLPRHDAPVESDRDEDEILNAARDHETILLVEDEPAILKMATLMLEKLGYNVLAANTPGKALEVAKTFGSPIHLVITDVVMPEMNGRDLAEQLILLHPDMKILFMSGYTANVIAHHGVLDEGVRFIPKPFSRKDIALKVREVLDA
jgi:PAS domain S-box-containing protein